MGVNFPPQVPQFLIALKHFILQDPQLGEVGVNWLQPPQVRTLAIDGVLQASDIEIIFDDEANVGILPGAGLDPIFLTQIEHIPLRFRVFRCYILSYECLLP